MGDSVCLDGMYPFCATVVKVFGKHTLGNQMLETARLLAAEPERGFLEMLRCIDYFMHYKCLVGASNVIHEAISSYNLWI
jgi:hypothetical protein